MAPNGFDDPRNIESQRRPKKALQEREGKTALFLPRAYRVCVWKAREVERFNVTMALLACLLAFC